MECRKQIFSHTQLYTQLRSLRHPPSIRKFDFFPVFSPYIFNFLNYVSPVLHKYLKKKNFIKKYEKKNV